MTNENGKMMRNMTEEELKQYRKQKAHNSYVNNLEQRRAYLRNYYHNVIKPKNEAKGIPKKGRPLKYNPVVIEEEKE